MMKPSPTDKEKTSGKSKTKWIYLGLYVLFSFFIIFECTLNAVASSNQSSWAARVYAFAINLIAPGQEITTVEPTGIEAFPDGRFVGGDKVVLGKTKLISYTLSFPSGGDNTVFDSDVTAERIDQSSEDDYKIILSGSSAGGALRIVPYVLGDDYKVRLKTNGDVYADYSFDIVDRLEPTNYSLPTSSLSLDINETYGLRPTLSSEEEISQENETIDHYLQRLFDYEKISKSSDDPSIATIDKYGTVKACSTGETTLHYGDKNVAVTVSSSSVAYDEITSLSFVDSIGNPLSEIVVHPDDYSSWVSNRLGSQAIVKVQPSTANQNVHFYMADPTKAMVSNSHLDSDGSAISGGYVQGYSLPGETTLYAISDADPSKIASCKVSISEAAVESVSLAYSYNGNAISAFSSMEVTAGDHLSISGSFQPVNATDKNIVVTSSDSTVAKVFYSGSSSPRINFLKEGSATVSIYPEGKPSQVTSLSFSIKAAPYISETKIPSVAHVIRKVGHATCFMLSAIFLLLFVLSFKPIKKRYWLGLLIAGVASLCLAFISEGLQYLVPGRGPKLTDVGIDFSGACVGILGVFLVGLIIKFKKKKDASASK